MKMVNLTFDKTLTGLAGNDFGKLIYTNQVKDKIDIEEGIVIVFPSTIERIAISFVQGFSEELINKYGLEIFNKKIKIEGSEKVENKFRKVLI